MDQNRKIVRKIEIVEKGLYRRILLKNFPFFEKQKEKASFLMLAQHKILFSKLSHKPVGEHE